MLSRVTRNLSKGRLVRFDRADKDIDQSQTRVKSKPDAEVADIRESDAEDKKDSDADDRDRDGEIDRDDETNGGEEYEADDRRHASSETDVVTDSETGPSDVESSNNRPGDDLVPSADAVARSPAQRVREPEPADAASAAAHTEVDSWTKRTNNDKGRTD
jgi:hypothetical protein